MQPSNHLSMNPTFRQLALTCRTRPPSTTRAPDGTWRGGTSTSRPAILWRRETTETLSKHFRTNGKRLGRINKLVLIMRQLIKLVRCISNVFLGESTGKEIMSKWSTWYSLIIQQIQFNMKFEVAEGSCFFVWGWECQFLKILIGEVTCGWMTSS